MPRAQQTRQFLNFVGGLNTESSPLVFPEGTAKDLDNVDLLRDGSLKRRRGINYEASGAYSTTTFSEAVLQDDAISAHEWTSVGGDDSLNFLVLQVGKDLFFHKLGDTALSTGIIGSLDMTSLSVDTDFNTEIIDADSAKGVLFIVGRSIDPAYIEYDADTNEFTGVTMTLQIRDVEGIDEETTITEFDDFTPIIPPNLFF
jgi:hypothetical protein